MSSVTELLILFRMADSEQSPVCSSAQEKLPSCWHCVFCPWLQIGQPSFKNYILWHLGWLIIVTITWDPAS